MSSPSPRVGLGLKLPDDDKMNASERNGTVQ
jgi:hypothetical protein